jgi:hypothetical protein
MPRLAEHPKPVTESTQPPLWIAHCLHQGCRRVFHALDAVSAFDAMERHIEAAHQGRKES